MVRRLRILVVDDDRDGANSLAELLQIDGHIVTTAYSGPEAVDAYRTQDFDIAFMDIMMPGRNGVESFFEIRNIKPDAKVYMMTAYSMEQLVKQALDYGALGVMSKPIDIRNLLDLLENMQPSGIVLIAEDDPELGPELVELIQNCGLNAELVTDGNAAVELARQGRVKILVLDLGLPVLNGIEVCAALKREHLELPIIIVTGNAGAYADKLEVLRDAKVTGILNKPFNPEILLAKIEELAARN